MNFSLNEIEAEVRKAVRGAGLSWGLGEEAGKAARWLASQNADASRALADILDRHDRHELDVQIVRSGDGGWRGKNGAPLCPLTLGAAICDDAWRLAGGEALRAERVAQPLLLLPFVARAARAAHRSLMLDADGWQTAFSAAGRCATPLAVKAMPEGAQVICKETRESVVTPDTASFARPDVDPSAWRRIERFAYRTYVPATEHSRLHGAGAGMIDND
ncbi:MAG: DUF3726 domain-containing protein [Pseudorhodoplanes sp.]|nr:DUF3726 domain-containing protein [Pseudorhodoplanes sp.]